MPDRVPHRAYDPPACNDEELAVGHLDDPVDPSLVFLGLQRELARHGITVEYAPHPLHGDVLARAARIEAGEPLDSDRPQVWRIDAESVRYLWAEIELCNPEVDIDGAAEGIAIALAAALTGRQVDELERRYGDDLNLLVYTVLDDGAADPRSVLLGLQRAIGKEGITVVYAPHPQHGAFADREPDDDVEDDAAFDDAAFEDEDEL
jgi:hypothetical protein